MVFWWQREGVSDWRRRCVAANALLPVGRRGWNLHRLGRANAHQLKGPEFDLSIVERCLIAGRAIWFYLGKLIWPADLVFIYPRWHISQAIWRQFMFPIAAAIAVGGVVEAPAQPHAAPPLAAGGLFFVGTLFPALGFLNVYPFVYSFVADHFQYLASLGIITLFSAGAALLLKRVNGRAPVIGHAGCVALLAVLAVLTWRQSRNYADIEALYQTSIDANPECWMAHNNLGFVFAERERFDEAIAHYQQAVKIKPDFAEAYNNLGKALIDCGRFGEAIAYFQKALEIKPNFSKVYNNLGNAHLNFGLALAGDGRVDEAIDHYRTALEFNPDNAAAHYSLGNALAQRQQFGEAIFHYQTALEIKPDYFEAHNNFGGVLVGRGRFQEAIVHYEKALAIKPDYIAAHFNLGRVLAECDRIDEAIAHFETAFPD